MSDNPGPVWMVRGPAYLLLALAAALLTLSTDAITLFLIWLAGVVLFEGGFFLYRRYKRSERQGP